MLVLTTIILKDTLELKSFGYSKNSRKKGFLFLIAYVLGQMQHEAAIPQLIQVKQKNGNQIQK